MTNGPQPLANGYAVSAVDESKYDWTVDIEGNVFSVTDQTQSSVCDWTVEKVRETQSSIQGDNFETAALEEVEWRDGVIHGKVQTCWWRDDQMKENTQYLADRMVMFTALPVT